MFDNLKLITTDDGSHSVFVPNLNEHYHSTFGAITESMHIFIQNGFNSLPLQQPISVFEVGFGTGLNALLTFLCAKQKKIPVTYHAVEKYPIEVGLASRLNYAEIIPTGAAFQEIIPTGAAFQERFLQFHRSAWNATIPVDSGFTLHKIEADFLNYIPDFCCDVVYFDAFAPSRQPEMWQKQNFARLFDILNPGGVLVTYCVQGQVKRALKETGFKTEILPGPPGKRHILRAMKQTLAL